MDSGILYNELYFQCIFCRVFVCEKCHEKHPSSHSRELVQIISKKCDSKSTTEKRLCLGCSKTAVSCMECKECNAAFCEECFQQKAADHDHRIFFSLEAPYHQVKLNSGSSQACCAKPAISHCTWCLKCKQPSFVLVGSTKRSEAIALSQHSLQCKTCLVSAGISVSVCEHCFPDAWAFHDQTHQSMSIAFIPVVDDSENGYGCSQCKYSNHLSFRIPE